MDELLLQHTLVNDEEEMDVLDESAATNPHLPPVPGSKIVAYDITTLPRLLSPPAPSRGIQNLHGTFSHPHRPRHLFTHTRTFAALSRTLSHLLSVGDTNDDKDVSTYIATQSSGFYSTWSLYLSILSTFPHPRAPSQTFAAHHSRRNSGLNYIL
ncbi:hypothetical protein M405DRAFT_859546 [Rhizopogon salebrosus TDB-379]|nr:hypothetical protein M405DRAFT_859546 [Rhizopogon salebrosus TDB-379]